MEGAHPPAGHALAPGVAIPVKREASTGAGTPTGRVLETWLPGLLEVLAEGFGRPSRNETLLLIARPEETLDSCRNKCSAHVCREAKRDEPDFGSVGRIGFRGRAGQAGRWAVGASSCNPIIYLFSWYKGFFPRASGSKGWRLFSSSWQGYNGPVFSQRSPLLSRMPEARLPKPSVSDPLSLEQDCVSPVFKPPSGIFCAHLARPARKPAGTRGK